MYQVAELLLCVGTSGWAFTFALNAPEKTDHSQIVIM